MGVKERGMGLTRVERERIKDSRLKLQSVADSLKHVSPQGVDGIDDIQECLKDAEKSLTGALKAESVE
jgi:hypothetical protein